MRSLLTLLVLSATLQAQHPSDAEAAELLEKARVVALRYSQTLPDFICTQTIHRYTDPMGNNRWQNLDVLTVKLAFFERHEDYKLMEINGKPTDLDYMNTGGPTTKGEFGSLLLEVFHPLTATIFGWKGWTSIHKRRAAVFGYKVDQGHSRFLVTYGAIDPNHPKGPNQVLAPYYGEVTFEPDTGQVLRITQHAILPAGFPISASSATVEYGYADVGDRQYLLPVRAETYMAAGRYKTRNEADFTAYRKFQTEATITFDK
ncbi:MAG: hypothetical protein JST11_16680 [Acidobacteria bacterium]|nr:hypothetical protein [Acidobacteriota bacterium]